MATTDRVEIMDWHVLLFFHVCSLFYDKNYCACFTHIQSGKIRKREGNKNVSLIVSNFVRHQIY